MRIRLVPAALSLLVCSAIADAAPAKDAKIVALANAAAKCKYEDSYFDDECKAYKAWQAEEKLFEDGKGDLTLLSMFEDTNIKMRALAASKGFNDFGKLADDKAIALRYLAAAKLETDLVIARSFAQYASRIDFEKLGLVDELKALAKHPLPGFRQSLGFNLYASKQTPARLEVTKTLLADADPKVQADAVKGLSVGAKRGKAPEACKLMGEQIARPDGDALWQVSSSGCLELFDKLAAELVKRANDPAIAAKDGVALSLALDWMCSEGNDAQKAKGFTASKALTDVKMKNANTRAAGISALIKCDKEKAKPIVLALTKDADKFVAERAQKELKALEGK